MSHFSTVKTELRDRTALINALRDLGHSPSEGERPVRGYRGQTVFADLTIAADDAGFAAAASPSGSTSVTSNWPSISSASQPYFFASSGVALATVMPTDSIFAPCSSLAYSPPSRPRPPRIQLRAA